MPNSTPFDHDAHANTFAVGGASNSCFSAFLRDFLVFDYQSRPKNAFIFPKGALASLYDSG